jgi:hypothetical protein
MSSAPFALATVLAVAIPFCLIRAYRRDERRDERWARDHDVEVTPDTRPVVARYLRNARICRTWGGVAGAVLPSLIEYAATGRVQVLGFGTDGTSAPLGFGTIFVGYLLGALVAELTLARPVLGMRRSASLARRDLADYLPHRVVVAQRALAVAGAVGMIASGFLPYPDGVSYPSLASLAVAAVVVLALAAGLEAIERWLVRRPQPYTSAELVRADDAIRAQSIRAVAGAGLALLLLFCCGVSLGLQASDVAVLRTAMVLPAAVFLVLSLVVCADIDEGAWRVQRISRPANAAST